MDLVDLLDKLVAIPSVSGNENLLSKFIEDWVKENTSHKPVRVKDSILISIAGANRHNCMVFNGHIDTVAPGDLESWQTDPFKLTADGRRLYGLGSSDMKGALAVMLSMLKHYDSNKPACDVMFMFVTAEETSSKGTNDSLDFIKRSLGRYKRVSVIIGEPSSLEVVLGHRGNAFVNIYFDGEGGHASRPPADKKQAIGKAIRFANSVPAKLAKWQRDHNDEMLGMPDVTVTQFRAGTGSINQIPITATVSLDVRTVPSLHVGIEEEITEWAKSYEGRAEILFPWPAGYCSPDEPIAATSMKLVSQDEVLVTQGATDQQFFSQAGIPAIIWGPGDKSVIHAPNEYIDKASLDKAYKLYTKIVQAWPIKE